MQGSKESNKDIAMPDINAPQLNVPDIDGTKDVDVYLTISEMPAAFPHYCETQCTAWNTYINGCAGFITQRKFCGHSVSKITKRIDEKRRINGDKWWK